MKTFLSFVAVSFFMTTANAQNVGIGTISPGTKLTVYTSGYGLENTDGTVSIKSYMYSPSGLAQIGTFSNHPFQLMANDGTGQFVLMPSGAVGIANSSPTIAGLVVDKSVGAVNAVFGSTTTGVSIESAFPGVGFNSYYNAGRKNIASGFGGVLGYNPNNGNFTFASSTASVGANVAGTYNNVLSITKDGAAQISGTAAGYIFNDRNPSSGAWNLYALAGKASLYSYSGIGNALTIDSAGNTEIQGNIKIAGGAPAAGKILTSDASGNGTWQKPVSPANNTAFRVAANSTVTVTSSSNVTIPFNFVYFDLGNNFNTNGYFYYISSADPAVYHFDLHVTGTFAAGTLGGLTLIMVDDNNGSTLQSSNYYYPANTTSTVNSDVAFNYYNSGGAQILAFEISVSSGTFTTVGPVKLSGMRL